MGNNFFGCLMSGLFYICIWYITLGSALSEGLKITSSSFEEMKNSFLSNVKIPLELLFDGIALFICYRINRSYFFAREKKLYAIIAKALRRGLKTAASKQNQKLLPKTPTCFINFLRNSPLLASCVQLGFTISITHMSVQRAIDNLIENNTYLAAVSGATFLITLVGSWITIGFITSTMAIRNKTFWISLLGMIVFLPCYALRTQTPAFIPDWEPFMEILWFGPPGYTLLMMSFSVFTMIHKRWLLLAFALTASLIFFPGFYLGCVLNIYGVDSEALPKIVLILVA